MGKRVKIQTAYTTEELHERYRQTKDAVERTHWHILWLAKEGKTPQTIAEQLGYTARWVRTVIGRWNAQGEAGIRDHRHEIDVSRPLLSPELQQELTEALQAPPADGGLWSGAIRGTVDAAASRPTSRSTTRVGVSHAARSQQSRASPAACQSRRGHPAGV